MRVEINFQSREVLIMYICPINCIFRSVLLESFHSVDDAL